MDAVTAYVAARAAAVARRKARRWLPALLVLLLISPLFIIVMITGAATSILSQDDGTGTTIGGACTSGGAVVAGNVKATWGGIPYSAEQIANAQTIVAVGRQKNVPAYGWLIAVTAAMTESTLNNVSGGDRDSLGLFQMRPSQGWGTSEQLTDPIYASGKFYDVLSAVTGWEAMQVGEAAQAVERSGFPGNYQPNAQYAKTLIEDPLVLGASCATAPVGNIGGTEIQQAVVAAAMSQLGVTYAWGGGDWYGPTYGVEYATHTYGFDCSGLTGYAWYQGTGGKVAMGTFTGDQETATVSVPKDQIQPGDLLLFPGHVGMYDGKGGMIHAPHTGTVVQVAPNILANKYWMGRLIKIGRPKAYLAMVNGQTAAVAAAGKGTP